MKKQKGFTLIELVVVIVILGILAVTAAPKFINLQADARTATLEGVKASMQSAATLIHSKSLIAGNETIASAATTLVVVNGENTQIDFGYPLADYAGDADAGNTGDWSDLIEVAQDFTSVVIDGFFIVHPNDVTAPTTGNIDPVSTATNNCYAYYTQASEAAGVITLPTYTVVDCL
jgi:MSHA pilin protein MshA